MQQSNYPSSSIGQKTLGDVQLFRAVANPSVAKLFQNLQGAIRHLELKRIQKSTKSVQMVRRKKASEIDNTANLRMDFEQVTQASLKPELLSKVWGAASIAPEQPVGCVRSTDYVSIGDNQI
jgi:hypothetical protein